VSTLLFHRDNDAHFAIDGLRHYAHRVVSDSSLIREAGRGDESAATALKIGFWPFVRNFERAIDQQSLPRRPLAEKFGAERLREIFIGLACAVREMKREEGSHAVHWRKDATCLGLGDLGDHRVLGVSALLETASTRDLPRFFAMLAGTELVAEELSRFLVGSPAFTRLFSRGRWMWGEVHLAPHAEGPSHLDIDLDLARAYGSSVDVGDITEMLVETIDLFGRAAEEIWASRLLIARERSTGLARVAQRTRVA
jgi:hypothetical protein